MVNERNTRLLRFIFKEHQKFFPTDDFKNTFVINKTYGPAKKWGLSLKNDGTIDNLNYETFKKFIIGKLCGDSGRKIRSNRQLLNLKQYNLGKAAFYTIEFRSLAKLIRWPDNVLIDLIRRGLLEEVKEEFDKIKKPSNLFEATNIIISIDKKCYTTVNTRKNILLIENNHKKGFKRRHFKNEPTEDKEKKYFKAYRGKNKQMLTANYTLNNENTMTTTFTIFFGTKSLKIKLMIDSGSARSFIRKNYVISNKIPFSNLPSTINIQLPNKNIMNITQTTKTLKLKFMDLEENFEFCIANLQLHGVSGILGRDWLNLHKPYINFENNHIYFLEKHCLEHCPSSKGNKFLFHYQNVTAPMIPLESVTYD